jgi:hypothetical protein
MDIFYEIVLSGDSHNESCTHNFIIEEYLCSIEINGEIFILTEIDGEKYYVNEQKQDLEGKDDADSCSNGK